MLATPAIVIPLHHGFVLHAVLKPEGRSWVEIRDRKGKCPVRLDFEPWQIERAKTFIETETTLASRYTRKKATRTR